MGFVAIVTGMAGLGKTTLGKALAAKHGVPLISADEYRFEPGSWVKVPERLFAEETRRRTAAAMASDSRGFVFESAYLDVHDPEDARGHAIRSLLAELDTKDNTLQLFVLRGSLDDVFAGVIDRACRRYAGQVPQGTGQETPQTVARLLLKLHGGYANVSEALDALQASHPRAVVGLLPTLLASQGIVAPF